MESVKNKARALYDEFKNFAFKGSVIDLAVGVIIGAAFGTIIKSLVDNIIMPLIAAIMPTNKSYTEWSFPLGGSNILFGKFLGDVVSFIVVALVLYIFIVKFLGWVMKTKKEDPPPPSLQERLLMEIRDLLKEQAKSA
jgi:large conductance mechanosensitive channel